MKYKRFYALILTMLISFTLFYPEAYAADKKTNTPSRVTGVKAVSSGHDSIKLTWKKVSSADGYKLYRSTKKNGSYKLIKTTKKTSYNNTKLVSNKTYYYKVKAYKTVKNKTYTSKKYSSTVSAKAKLTKVTKLKATQKSNSSITLSWEKGTNTKYYSIYRKDGKNGTYEKIKTTSKLSYTDKKLEANKAYYYKIKAYNKRGDKRQYTSFCNAVKITIAVPEITTSPVTEATTSAEETTTDTTTTEATTTDAATTEVTTAETTTVPSTEATTAVTTTEATTTEVTTTEATTVPPTTEVTTTEPVTETPAPEETDCYKPENTETAKAFIDQLHTDAISDDYTLMCLPWERANRKTNWIYYTGLVFDGFLQLDFNKYYSFMVDFYNQYISDTGKIKTYATGELDSAMLGAPLLEIMAKGNLTTEEKTRFNNGINYIYNQLQKQTIYPEAGNLWLHSQKSDGTPRPAWTKWNICLDGIYMSQIFLIRLTEALDNGTASIVKTDGTLVTSDEIWKDIYSRLAFAAESFKDEETGLLYHGYCVETGETNKAFWSRGLGWYTMVLLEGAEKIPQKDKKEALTAYYNSIMEAVVNHQDSASSLWYNVTDGREEYFYTKTTENGEEIIYNIPETSGSAMFTYCLLAGYHKGLLKDEKFRTSGLKAFNALVEVKLTADGLTDIYTSSSVTSNKNLYQKNGYTTNDGKGVGPFIMATKYAY